MEDLETPSHKFKFYTMAVDQTCVVLYLEPAKAKRLAELVGPNMIVGYGITPAPHGETPQEPVEEKPKWWKFGRK